MKKVPKVDSLKALSEIHLPDRRYLLFGPQPYSLEVLHGDLDALRLSRFVPLDVRTQFEVAKNVALYSYFAYRVAMASQMYTFATLELALKLKCDEMRTHPKRKGLRAYLEHAVENEWLNDSVFSYRAHLWRGGKVGKPLEMMNAYIDFAILKRNSLMHGSFLLDLPWETVFMLRDASLIIDRLFVEKRTR
jgi:hypothetical protein